MRQLKRSDSKTAVSTKVRMNARFTHTRRMTSKSGIKKIFGWQELYYVRGLGDKLRGYKIYRAQGGKEFNTIPAELLDVMISTWAKYVYYFPSRENPEELEDFYEWVEKYLSFRDKLEVNISPCR